MKRGRRGKGRGVALVCNLQKEHLPKFLCFVVMAGLALIECWVG